jgi:hypothetical protein
LPSRDPKRREIADRSTLKVGAASRYDPISVTTRTTTTTTTTTTERLIAMAAVNVELQTL